MLICLNEYFACTMAKEGKNNSPIPDDDSVFMTLYMTSDKIIVLLLHKNNAVSQFRKLIGNTNPELADSGTIRKLYAVNQTQNSIHGSDSDINANVEINFFFKAPAWRLYSRR